MFGGSSFPCPSRTVALTRTGIALRLFAVTTLQPSIRQFLLKPCQVLRVVNAVGIDLLQPYMVQCSYAIFIKEWFPMFEGRLANMFATFLHLPCQQAVYTSMVQSNGNMLSFHTLDTTALSSAMI